MNCLRISHQDNFSDVRIFGDELSCCAHSSSRKRMDNGESGGQTSSMDVGEETASNNHKDVCIACQFILYRPTFFYH